MRVGASAERAVGAFAVSGIGATVVALAVIEELAAGEVAALVLDGDDGAAGGSKPGRERQP